MTTFLHIVIVSGLLAVLVIGWLVLAAPPGPPVPPKTPASRVSVHPSAQKIAQVLASHARSGVSNVIRRAA